MNDAPYGVSLEVYAGVLVALSEGHDLGAALEQEHLALDVWRAAEPVWKARLAASAARGDAEFNAYRARTFEAEDALARRLDPVDDDLGAWLAFAKAWAASPDPAAFLGQHGLSAGDVSRLRRGWDARFEAEPSLAVKAARLVAEGQVGAMPPLRASRACLVPFPWSRGRSVAPRGGASDAHGDDRDARYLAAHRHAREQMLATPPSPPPRIPAVAAPVVPATPPSIDATSTLLPVVVLEPLPFVATEPAVAPPSSTPLAPHPNVGETVELAALSDAELFGATPAGPQPSIHATAVLDAFALVDVDAPLPFPPRRS